MFRFRSVVGRTVALHLLAIVLTSIFMPLALYLMLKQAAEALHDRALRQQASEIIGYLASAPGGGLRLDLPAPLAELYSEAYGRYAFAVLDENGKVLFSSLSGKRAITQAAQPSDQAGYFTAKRGAAEIYGVSLPADVAGQRISVQVSQDLAHRDVLIDDIVADFFSRVGWITAPILLLLLIIDVVIFRRALKPIIAASALAQRIGPRRTELRLPESGMPQEIRPLVHAVNEALDRLDEGFRAQREFTADAAHELRTPLSILRAQVDMIADRELARSLRHDLESMTRLVNQLLDMAELETLIIASSETADLVAIASEVAAFLAPLALSKGKTVAVTGVHEPVLVSGNPDTLARALRNLVENALAHTPTDSLVEISIDRAGSVRVSDQGPGVAAADKEQIFRRFWRRDRRRAGNAGLGLSIVARIADMHHATIEVEDRPGGGAVFVLAFPRATSGEQEPAHARAPELAPAE